MASGSRKRFTTVHDRAALRVHPDGTRVSARESRYATQDLRGNRVAANAGGIGNVKKRKRAASPDEGTEPQEEFDIETDEYQPTDNQSSSADSCAGEVEDEPEGGGKNKRRRKDPRTIKRTQFYQDFDFILGGQRGVEIAPAPNGSLLPSSDLLKCLHHFAARYYSEKGQLMNASRIARQKKKAKMSGDTGSRSGSLSTSDSFSGEESDESGAGISTVPSATPPMPNRKGRQGADHVKDMYKMLDGSALVALGVFVHEHIERLVRRDWVLGLEEDPEQESVMADSDEDEGEDEK